MGEASDLMDSDVDFKDCEVEDSESEAIRAGGDVRAGGDARTR